MKLNHADSDYEHREDVATHCKAWSAGHYRISLDKYILPELGAIPVRAVEREHIAALHLQLRDRPYAANQRLLVLTKMFSLAETWGLRAYGTSPCRLVPRYRERRRERFLCVEAFHRLDPVLITVCVDEPRHVLGRRSSSAWAKYADALRRISFARRSSRFTLSSALKHSRSALVSPGRRLWSRSACRTHLRNVSFVQPIFSAIDPIAAHCESWSLWCSSTMRTTRSRTSGEYLFEELIALSSQVVDSPDHPVQFNWGACVKSERARGSRVNGSQGLRCTNKQPDPSTRAATVA